MLYDNGSTTQQVSMNEKNARAAEELIRLKENARLKAEQQKKRQIATAAQDLGRQEVLSEIENKLTKNFEIQQMADREAIANNAPLSTSQYAVDSRNNVSQDLGQAIKRKMQSAGSSISGLFDYFTKEPVQNERVKSMANSERLEQESNNRNNNFQRIDEIFGPNNSLSEIELSNAITLMESDKGWSNDEIRKMALNKN
jgi:hypothetical protein